MAVVRDIFKPGDKVSNSGICEVVHDTNQVPKQEGTCVAGSPFDGATTVSRSALRLCSAWQIEP